MSQQNNRGAAMPSPSKKSPVVEGPSVLAGIAPVPVQSHVSSMASPGVAADVQQRSRHGFHDLSKIPNGPLNVQATHHGFYNNFRKAPGDKFTIRGKSELGRWMKILK